MFKGATGSQGFLPLSAFMADEKCWASSLKGRVTESGLHYKTPRSATGNGYDWLLEGRVAPFFGARSNVSDVPGSFHRRAA